MHNLCPCIVAGYNTLDVCAEPHVGSHVKVPLKLFNRNENWSGWTILLRSMLRYLKIGPSVAEFLYRYVQTDRWTLRTYQAFLWVCKCSSSVGIVTCYGLVSRHSIPGRGKGLFCTPQRSDWLCEAHPVSYPMGTGDSFPKGKAARTWSWRRSSLQCWGQEWRSSTSAPPCVFMAWCLIN
jgi:hypothetical protein